MEVQILTLEGHRQREENSEVRHEEYKRRQFMNVFPLWWPRRIYGPMFSKKGL